jgi:hypothetical protein
MSIEPWMFDDAFATNGQQYSGLTKLEYAAIHIATALKSNPNCDYDSEGLVHDSISAAVAILRGCRDKQ